jgi:alanyl-tRNA synthetase
MTPMSVTAAIRDDTRVTFPVGALTGASPVLAEFPCAGLTAVICARTPFHPVDHSWPDQPGDRGLLYFRGLRAEVVDCITGTVHKTTGEVQAGTDITAKRGDPEWHWVVLHLLRSLPDGPWPARPVVQLSVDEGRRTALSAAHTACHLSGLALNEFLADLWSADRVPRQDSLGHPNLDSTALARSEIAVEGFHDTYRLGRSLRRSGFETARVAGMVTDIGAQLTERIAGWIEAAAKVWIQTATTRLSAPRTWHCALPEGEADIACGGTHPDSLAALKAVRINASLAPDGKELYVRGDVDTAVCVDALGD